MYQFLPYSMSAFLLCVALALWLLSRAAKRPEKSKIWLTNFKRFFVILALWAFWEQRSIWFPEPKRLPILDMKQLTDFRAGDAAALAGSSHVWFGNQALAAGFVTRERLSALGVNLNSRIGDPGENRTLFWIINAKATTVRLDIYSIFITDAIYEENEHDIMRVGWLAEPLLPSVRKIDAAIN